MYNDLNKCKFYILIFSIKWYSFLEYILYTNYNVLNKISNIYQMLFILSSFNFCVCHHQHSCRLLWNFVILPLWLFFSIFLITIFIFLLSSEDLKWVFKFLQTGGHTHQIFIILLICIWIRSSSMWQWHDINCVCQWLLYKGFYWYLYRVLGLVSRFEAVKIKYCRKVWHQLFS